MKKFLVVTGVLLVLAAVLAACGGQPAAPTAAPPTAVPATEVPTAAPVVLSGDFLRGAKLYDNWLKELDVDVPEIENPKWTAANAGKISVVKSYRCVTCHGYDYKGDHGFVGVQDSAVKDANDVLAVLKGSTNNDHDFSSFMDDQALTDMALYLTSQQIDTDAVLALTGVAANGKKLFDENCIDCHGPQAIAINFHPDNSPEYPASIANEDPLEMLGKLRFGQPGVPAMPAGVDLGFTDQDFADMAAFLKAQPQASPVTEGGRIYDKWFTAFGVKAPEGDHPLWKTQSTNTRTGEVSWRCKECHGWDYKGVDGVYGGGSHKTGFKGILSAASMSAEELTAWLDGSKNADHNFSPYFTADDFARLVAFIQKDVFDKSTIINADKTLVSGDAAHGKVMFNGVCKSCHGEDGKAINFGNDAEPEFVGTIAAGNPWEFYNKATVGVPGEPMPAGSNLGWTLQDILDLMAYAQTLPTK